MREYGNEDRITAALHVCWKNKVLSKDAAPSLTGRARRTVDGAFRRQADCFYCSPESHMYSPAPTVYDHPDSEHGPSRRCAISLSNRWRVCALVISPIVCLTIVVRRSSGQVFASGYVGKTHHESRKNDPNTTRSTLILGHGVLRVVKSVRTSVSGRIP